MEEKELVVQEDTIRNKVYTIRGRQVMLDADLAEIYGYEAKAFICLQLFFVANLLHSKVFLSCVRSVKCVIT